MDKEIRTREIEFSIDNDVISGKPIVFNALSEVLWDPEHKRAFREVIAPEALSQQFIDGQDVMLNVGHDRSKVLARRKRGAGSLNMEWREDGVVISTNTPATQLGRDTYEMIKRGDYQSMSFCYTDGMEEGSVTWNFKTEDGIPVRTVHRMSGLYDVAIVYSPAFSQTSVTARSIDDLEQQLKDSIQEVPPVEELEGFKDAEEAKALEVPEETVQELIGDNQDEKPENSEINKTEEDNDQERDNAYLEEIAAYREKLEKL